MYKVIQAGYEHVCKNLEDVIELLYDEDEFDDLLDECYGTIELIGTIYSTSKVLKQTDPLAYQCYLADEKIINFPNQKLNQNAAMEKWNIMEQPLLIQIAQTRMRVKKPKKEILYD